MLMFKNTIHVLFDFCLQSEKFGWGFWFEWHLSSQKKQIQILFLKLNIREVRVYECDHTGKIVTRLGFHDTVASQQCKLYIDYTLTAIPIKHTTHWFTS